MDGARLICPERVATDARGRVPVGLFEALLTIIAGYLVLMEWCSASASSADVRGTAYVNGENALMHLVSGVERFRAAQG